jgi:hypothetical protein
MSAPKTQAASELAQDFLRPLQVWRRAEMAMGVIARPRPEAS